MGPLSRDYGINDYTVDVATFSALAKIKSSKIFMQYTSASFGEIFLPQNISAIHYRDYVYGIGKMLIWGDTPPNTGHNTLVYGGHKGTQYLSKMAD